MNQKTQKITTGAMFVAIFAIILLINRQTGSLMEEFIFFLLPIPMVAFSAKYGLKSSIPVWVAMSLLSVLFGTLTTIFYAVTEAGVGLVLGTCIYKKVDPIKTILTVVCLSALVNVLNTVVLASLFGYDINTTITEMQTMLTTAFQNSNMSYSGTAIEAMLETDFLLRMFVISMIVMGMIQGYLVYQISLLILRRLRFKIPKPQSLYTIYPWKWTGIVAGVAYIAFVYFMQKGVDNQILDTLITTAGTFGALYLTWFGAMMILLISKKCISGKGFVGVLIIIACFLFLSNVLLLMGVLYITTSYHRRLMEVPDHS